MEALTSYLSSLNGKTLIHMRMVSQVLAHKIWGRERELAAFPNDNTSFHMKRTSQVLAHMKQSHQQDPEALSMATMVYTLAGCFRYLHTRLGGVNKILKLSKW